MDIDGFDLIVVGAGFFGATVAERAAALGLKVCVLDRRSHIGGNAYSETDPATGIEVHRYGTHIFHTSSEPVWTYLNRFTRFTDYRHRVMTVAGGLPYPMPINLATLSAAYGRMLRPDEARALVATEAAEAGIDPNRCTNLEGKAIALVGRRLYELLIRGYTRKQWQTDPLLLPAEIIGRLPMRFDFNDRYFADRYEGMPVDGYTAIFRRMLDHPLIATVLDIDYHEIAGRIRPGQFVVHTGPIDRFFNYRCGRLGWRTVDLEREVHDTSDFQGTAVVNYADANVPWTRIHEFRHLHPERRYSTRRTVIHREYSRAAGPGDEPYYPINTDADRKTYAQYQALAATLPDLAFGGRLGTYRYLDMHQAIGAALKLVEHRVVPFFARTGTPIAAE